MDINNLAEKFAFSSATKPLIWLTGNRFAQNVIDGVHHVCQHLMGIGSGAGLSESGEKAGLLLLNEVFSPPFTLFDVGANVGGFIQMTKQTLQPGSFVIHAFEPAAQTFEKLQDTYGKDNACKLNHTAVSESVGHAKLYSDRPQSRLASLSCRDLSQEGKIFNQTEEVQTTTLDAYCRHNAVSFIHLLKIDVEGHDLDVMNGAEELLRKKAIGILTFELCSAHIDARVYFRDLYCMVRKHGMEVFRITRSGYLYHLPLYHERYEQFWTTNFLCIRGELSHKSRRTAVL